ncbi:hypothetical protein [Fluviicola sp.]|uniref:hypothetical protein n=1 Tax=Fluviicola sp. TaxID=1917219 RepID=UPI0031D39CFE
MGTLLKEELEDQILHTKINYLNGYLSALAMMSSYSIVGMDFKLYLYPFYAGDIERAIQYNSYELFGVHTNEWNIELVKTDHWKARLKEELYMNFKRSIPVDHTTRIPKPDYSQNDLTDQLRDRFYASINYFVELLEDEFVTSQTDVYEMKVKADAYYRIVGIDLIFEISDTKLVVLQIMGND